jgi:hypothetical protein
LKKCSTPRLFYQKYPYKILWYTEFSHYFRNSDLSYARDVLDRCQQQLEETGRIALERWRGQVVVPREELFNAQRAYNALANTSADYQLRIEGTNAVIYADDRDWLYNLGKSINAVEWWEPKSDLIPNTIIMGPKMKGWEYKITLGSKVPEEFLNWVPNNLSKLKVGNTLLESIEKKMSYLDGYYFYVRNEKMLNLVTLVLGRGLRRIDKIIIAD